MTAYYNEFDPFAAAWLRELIADGLIAPGEVGERSITDVDPADLVGYTQCHFFAGIGGWSAALRLAGWPDDRPVWTGSCPCQPFSAAGKGGGHEDARHLWPAFYRLIAECRPSVVFGEQVASGLGRTWLAAVRADLEGMGYAVGAADLCAASVGAPHIRQRLWWVAERMDNAAGTRCDGAGVGAEGQTWDQAWVRGPECGRPPRRLADAEGAERAGIGAKPDGEQGGPANAGGLGEAEHQGSQGHGQSGILPIPAGWEGTERHGAAPSPWADLDWLPCRDGKSRPTQPGLFPLAHGVPNRMGTLRGAGNAIVPQVAAAFVRAYMDCRP